MRRDKVDNIASIFIQLYVKKNKIGRMQNGMKQTCQTRTRPESRGTFTNTMSRRRDKDGEK